MTSTVWPELLTAESLETATRLAGLSGRQDLGPAEADYVFAIGVAALQRVPKLWPIIRGRIGAGMMALAAQQLLSGLLNAVDKNLALAAALQERIRSLAQELGRAPEGANGLDEAQARLLAVRDEAVRLAETIEVPARWPTQEQLAQAKQEMQSGLTMSADEFRQALLDD